MERLANALPDMRQRREETLRQLARLRQQQEEVAQLAEQAERQTAKADPKDDKSREQAAQKMAEASRKQAEVAEELGKLDAPNQEARKTRAAEAAANALADLMDARPGDAAATQRAAKQQPRRLEQAIAGKKPVEDRASAPRAAARAGKWLAGAASRPRARAGPKACPRATATC